MDQTFHFGLRRAARKWADALEATTLRPNIVLIMADDMGFSDIGCYGSEIDTPNLDRLARNGVRFTQFYNCARCCPTRASLLTGLYPHQAGIGQMVDGQTRGPDTPAYQGYLNRDCVTIAEVLGASGYRTLMAGKWHVGGGGIHASAELRPRARGFERFWGIAGGGTNYFEPSVNGRGLPNALLDDDELVQAEGYFTDMITDRAAGFIDTYASDEAPFFLYVAYTAPHWPLHAPHDDIDKYAQTYRVGWDVVRRRRYERLTDMGIIDPGCPLTPRDAQAPPWDGTADQEWQARRMAVYAAQIDRMDQGIGRIVSKLEAKGVLDHTLVMFLSDNGGCAEELRDNQPSITPGTKETWASYGLPWANASNTPFRLYKHWTHEGGIATPFIAHWPDVIQSGGLLREPGHVMDVMTTCVDISGSRYPQTYRGRSITPMEGRSLAPLFRGKALPERRIFWEHEGNRAVREGRWKLVSRFRGGSHNAATRVDGDDVDETWHLYDMDEDRTECRNLAGARPDKAKELAGRYEEWAERVGAGPWTRWQPGTGKP